MTLPERKTTLLLESWHNGEESALNELIRKHAEWIHRKAHSCMSPALRTKLETVDLVQETMLEFLRYGPRCRFKNGRQFRGLMLKIMERRQYMSYRRLCARRRDMALEKPLPNDTVLDLESPIADPCETADKNERLAWIRLGMEFLSESEHEAICLRNWENLSFVDMGNRLGTTEDAARMRYKRAVGQLDTIVSTLRRGRLEDLIPPADD